MAHVHASKMAWKLRYLKTTMKRVTRKIDFLDEVVDRGPVDILDTILHDDIFPCELHATLNRSSWIFFQIDPSRESIAIDVERDK
mmetsp:Transcript_19947/g.31277  ORF Transcript_19947/g.31277 Transcript_19947/m.31277 type:complete len:85 (-) Transcript_19947:716-970(-)